MNNNNNNNMAPPAAGKNGYETTPVFITTSLDTRLLTMLSPSDTVSHFKNKIMLEHIQCFPAIGNIKIHSLKVKRRGVFYHLSDSMLVNTAFGNTKGSWFVSVDASTLEQDIDKDKAGDRLALPWVTHNGSLDRHDYHGSLSIQTKTVPLENQIVSNVDGGSCKDVAKSFKENGSSDDKQLAVYKEINSRKRVRDVSNDGLPNDPSGCGLSVKKKRKTQRVKNNVEVAEETMVLMYDNDKVKDSENTFERKSKDKDLIGENTRINDHEGAGRETVADVAMVAEKNIQHGMSEKERDNELVQKAVIENEIPSLSVRTSECERDAAGLTVLGPLKGGFRRSIKHKEAEEEDRELRLKQGPEVNLPERIKKVRKSAAKNKKETPVMHADDKLVGDTSSTILAPILDEKVIGEKNEALDTTLVENSKKNDEMIVKEMEVSEPPKSSRNQVRVENMEEKSKSKLKDSVGSRKRKKDVEKTALKNDEAVIKQSDDVAKSIDGLHVDCVRNDEILMNNDVELSGIEKPLSEVRVENIDDKSEKQNEKIDGGKKSTRKKKTKKSASRNESNDVATSMDALHVDCVRNDDILMNGDVELLGTDKNLSEVKVENIDGELEKQNEKMDGVKKSTRKNKTKKIASRNEDESMTKQHVNGGIYDNVKKGDSRLPDGDREDAQHVYEGLVGKAKKNNKSSLTSPQDRLSELQSTEVELELKKSQGIDHRHVLEDTSKNVTVSEVSKVNNEVDIANDGSHEINFMDHFAPEQPDKSASIDNRKEDTKKPKKKTKDDTRNDGDIQSQKISSKNEGLVRKAKKSNKSSLTVLQDRLSKLQSTEAELESNKSQSVDHHHHLVDASKIVTGSEVSKVNNEVGITNEESSEINFMDHFAPGHQSNKLASIENEKEMKKPKKKTKDDSNIPNIDQLKTPRTTRNIDAESSSSSKSFGRSFRHRKSNKQQSAVVPVKKTLPAVNSSLNTPGNIFGDDESDRSSADDNAAVNSDCSTRTPSRVLTSSSGESDSSIDSRRNRSLVIKRKLGGKNRTSENKSKSVSMVDLLRSSSRFKKARFTASQVDDTESQPVDFVPDSQPLG
ncbi:hypothetical protein M8C21_027581 [Ambrosia artemisiifolia]|uniref:Uncharacterized protein n=1 Tax=Ambrosia artemisiifolia TaxID=4212 RepID=A0AAD5BSE6_AMBAR|nr:hypothetical protein M8C21_027581 [Ambrosia artemisiifolia]